MKTKIISILILIILCGFVWFQANHIKNLNASLTRVNYNMSQLESDNYSLTFKKGELEDYIKQGNTKFKQDIDSVCNQYDIKIKDLKKVINTKTTITVKDTVYVPTEVIKIENDSLYHSEFLFDSACLYVRGRVLSTDSLAQLIFDNLECDNESFSMVYKEKKKWWQWFKKRKLIMKTVSRCGETTVKELEVIK